MTVYLYIDGEQMALSVAEERARVALEIAAADMADGFWADARDQALFAVACLDEIALAKEMAA